LSFLIHLDEALAARRYTLDASQRAAADRLERLYDDWAAYKAQRANALQKLINRPDIPRGAYLWGGVGRGKSFLMDVFFAHVPLVRKTRIHFHEFMRGVHRELGELKGTVDPLDAVAARIARRARLICFDEFHVSDIADAMILHRLLAKLFELRVGFVMTSNYSPDGLYPDGLHRDRMFPAIALLKEKLDVIHVDGGIDYRQRAISEVDVYLVPGPAQPAAAISAQLHEAFTHVAESEDDDPVLAIEGRRLRAKRRAGGVVWFDFATLCGGPRSQNDYLEIASQFHTVIVSDVPQMSSGQASEARRFTWLIDVMYDHRIKLIVSAAAPPEQLYRSGALSNEFARTASRLIEMQSAQYLEAPRRRVAQRV
jgi:cell division protein ZapE